MQHTRPLAKGAALTVGAMALVTGPLASGTWAAEKEPARPDRTERAERAERDDDTSVVTEDDDTNDDAGNNEPDDGDNRHPSGKDRSVESGGSGNQGAAAHDPDDDGNGPDRSNGGLDQPGDGDLDEQWDLEDQDGNNGCGNDDDFEDDNEGLCGKPTAPPAVDEVDDEDEVVADVEDDTDEVDVEVESDDDDDDQVRSSTVRRTPVAAITSTPATPLALTAEVLSNGLTAPAAAPAAEVQAAAATSAPAGELPFTGSNGPAAAIAGAFAVAGGWLLTRLGRTRRHTTA